MIRRNAFPIVLALLVTAVACGGGGGGGDGGDDPPGAVREQEPNDLPAGALDLGAVDAARIRGSIATTANDGRIATGDLDLFRFTATRDGRVRLTLAMPDGADHDLALLSGAGARLATSRADNRMPAFAGEERLTAVVRRGESYLLEVSGYAGLGGEYRLDLRVDPDPAPGSVTAAGTSVSPTGNLAERRCFHAAVALDDGRALVAGGTRSAESQTAALLSAISTTEIYEPAAGTFSPGPGLGGFRFGLTGTRLPDGRVLLAGGDLDGTADLFDPGEDAMSETALPLAGGLRFLHTATLLPDGRVLLVGGVSLVILPAPAAPRLATTEIFDPKTLVFTPGPDLVAPRFGHAACLLADGRVLVVGGEGRGDTEVVDPVERTSSGGPNLTGARDDHTATRLLDGRILVAGGQGADGASLDTAEILDDASAAPAVSFRLLAARMSEKRADQQAVLLPSGQVLLFGGENDPGDGGADAILTSVDRFETASETFAPMPSLGTGRDDHRTVRLPDGTVLITGGEDAASRSIREAEIYAPR